MVSALLMNAARAGPCFDVCNGDADGLCAVRQWRLHDPQPATLITGLKREIQLLERVPLAGEPEVLVCDIALLRNREALDRLLAAGASVRYFDHHAAGPEIPVHPRLEAHIDHGSRTCSSLLVDRCLGGRFRDWALVGAYGDNLTGVADTLAQVSCYGSEQRHQLKRVGEAINYNAYGGSVSEVCIAPAELYALMARHADPFELLAEEDIIPRIEAQRAADLQQATRLEPAVISETARVSLLPDAPWGRRVVGTWANELCNANPRQAQALLLARPDGGFVVSVRAPQRQPNGAGDFCARFGGTGRAAAGGIDLLPASEFERFVEVFLDAWPFVADE